MRVAVLMAAIAALWVQPAKAVTIVADWTGVVGWGIDYTDYFQTGDGDLAGQPFTVNFRFNLDQADVYTASNAIGAYLAPSNGIATLTINSVSWAVTGGPHAVQDYFRLQEGGLLYILNRINNGSGEEGDPGYYGKEFEIADSFDAPSNELFLDTPFSGSGTQAGPNGGAFNAYYQVGYTPVFWLAGATGVSVAIQAITVPEPSAWALLLLGIGATGALLRRRALVLA